MVRGFSCCLYCGQRRNQQHTDGCRFPRIHGAVAPSALPKMMSLGAALLVDMKRESQAQAERRRELQKRRIQQVVRDHNKAR